MAKKKLNYGKKDVLDADEFDPKYAKVSISIRIDGPVLQAVKAAADEKGVKYQSLINSTLKGVFSEQKPINQSALDKILHQLGGLSERVENLEHKRKTG